MTILRVLALLAFAIGAVICFVADPVDVVDLFVALFIGLGLWIASTLVPDR